MSITLKDISQETGLSLSAISHILNNKGKFSPDTKMRVMKTAERLGYKPHLAARTMRTGRTHQIGVLIRNHPKPEVSLHHCPNAFLSLLGINYRMEEEGDMVSLIRITDVDNDEACSRVFKEHALDGVIVFDCISEQVEKAIRSQFKNIIWMETNRWESTNCIRRDEYTVGKIAAQRLIESGYRKFVWTCGQQLDEPNLHYSIHQRYNGVADVAKEAGVPVDFLKIRFTSEKNDEELQKNITSGLGDISHKIKPDCGVVANSYYTARELKEGATICGLNLGIDYGLVCCDSEYNWPMLTQISFDRYELGYRAASMMLEVVTGGEDKEIKSVYFPAGELLAGNTDPGPRKENETRQASDFFPYGNVISH